MKTSQQLNSIKTLAITFTLLNLCYWLSVPANADIVLYSPVGAPVFIDEANPFFDVNLDEAEGDTEVDFSIEYDFGSNFTLEGAIPSNIIDADGLANASFLFSGDIVGPTDADWIDSTGLSEFIGQRGFVGFQFDIDGMLHFGYLDVELNDDSDQLLVYGGAFENVAGATLLAGAGSSVPEPGTSCLIGLLTGLMAFRRTRVS